MSGNWNKWALAGEYLVGAALMTTGAVVMVGWQVQSSLLVQIHASFAPMQFNTALCFLLFSKRPVACSE